MDPLWICAVFFFGLLAGFAWGRQSVIEVLRPCILQMSALIDSLEKELLYLEEELIARKKELAEIRAEKESDAEIRILERMGRG